MLAPSGHTPELLERLWLFGGKLHPLVVHFPIALLLVAVVLELLRRRRDDRPGRSGLGLLAIGAGTAAFAAVLGWSGAETAAQSLVAVEPHRIAGVAAAALAVLALLVGLASRVSNAFPAFVLYRSALIAAAASVAVAGHLGGELVHGDGYLGDALAALRGTRSPSLGAPDVGVANADAVRVDFVAQVRPILARRCLSCHSGSDPASSLSFDTRAALLAGGESGRPAVIPGDPKASRLLAVLDGSDPEVAMPPKGGALSADDIAAIAQWIAQGAAFDDEGDGAHWHWAYRPPVRRNPPPVRDTMWARTPVDTFVLARLEQEGLHPSAPADLATLARRVALDLTGLPPTIERLDALLADERADAYERYVDELLDSPHYGEHWARMWMDLGRYADTHGYEKDGRRTMWPWRDWVIDAYNRDLPFDRFSIEQLAGDLLPSPTLEQVVATGFNRNTQINEEGGTNPEEFRIDAVIDRVNTVSSVWLGSTIACAQCHDHKFDPFSQHAYFQMVALFNQDDPDVVSGLLETSAAGGTAPWGPPAVRANLERLWGEREAIVRELDEGAAIRAEQSAWEASMADRPQLDWTPLLPERVPGPERVEFMVAEDGVVSLAGASPPTAVYTVDTIVEPATIAALRLDLPLPPSPYRAAVGRSGNGNIVLTGIEMSVLGKDRDGDEPSTSPVAFARASADFEQPGDFGGGGSWPVAAALDDDPSTGWAVGPRTGREHTAWFVLEAPLVLDQPTRLRVVLRQEWGNEHTLARFRLLTSAVAPPAALVPLPAAVEAALAKADAARTPADRLALDTHFRDLSPLAASIRARLAAATAAANEAATATAMVMRSNPLPRETHVHQRGNFRNPGERVEPGVPEVLALREAPGPTTRLEFAEWLFAPGHPLTGRVAANRLWERLFGQGLVRTSEDFGTQGDPPTHPELLDWLATEYPRLGWSQKSMLRLLVNSATYRQSSIVTPELLERDPENRLLARGPRFRVEAETIRDIALTASGLLAPAIGGPSVFPPQPPGVWTMIYSNDQWVNSEGADRYRRGLYTFARRTAPYPTFTAFDAPSREIACTRRSRTNTPLQALVTLNDPQFVEAAAALSRRLIAIEDADDRTRIADGFRRCTARMPEEAEIATLAELLDRERGHYRAAPEQAAVLTGLDGDAAVEAAAMQAVASVLLNLDETMTKE